MFKLLLHINPSLFVFVGQNSDNKLLTFTLNNHNTLTSSNVFSAINYKYQLLGLDYAPEQSHEHHGHIEVLFLLLIRLFFCCPFYWAQSKKEKLNCIDARSQCSRCPGHVVATANWRYADVLTKPICSPSDDEIYIMQILTDADI